MIKRTLRILFALGTAAAYGFLASSTAGAQEFPLPQIQIGIGASDEPSDWAVTLQVLFLLTVLSLAPAILVMVTSFTRIVIVLGFVRTALATNQVPPTQVITGLALFLTAFVMAPTWQSVYQDALQPMLANEITAAEAYEIGMRPLREFMLANTREADLALFIELSDSPEPETPEDVPTFVLIPAFLISELKTAFQLGFILFVPFLVIDMIVASTLMSMGMLMLPPVMISLPFKILLFVMVDGWNLITRSLISGYS